MPPAAPPRPDNAALLYGWDVFVSFALGPPPRGSRSYASDLARRLRERDFTVFFSEEEAAPGATLDDTLRRALHRARCLVVVANRGTLADPRWVRLEVEEFRRRHPERPVIPISIDGALQDPALGPAANAWLGFEGRIWIDESARAFDEGVASDGVIERLVAAPRLQRAGVRWRRTVRAAFALLGTLTLAATWFAWSQYRAELEARSGRLAAESQLARAGDPALALLLAAEAWRTRPTPPARAALAAALGMHPRLVAQLERVVGADGYELNLRALRYSADGRRLYALAGTARAADRLVGWDLATLRRLPLAWPDGLRPAVFVADPQGQVLVALAQPGDPATTMQVWNAETGRFVGAPLENLADALAPELLTPDGRQVALGDGGPPQVQVRRLDNGTPVHDLLAEQRLSRTRLLLSADGRQVHGLTLGRALHRWNLPDWSPAHATIDLQAVSDILNDGFAASADGRWLAFGGTGRRPQLWDLSSGAPAERGFAGHTEQIESLAFSADSTLLASASWDGTVRVWRAAGRDDVDPRPLAAHQGIVRHALFSPAPAASRRLASAGADGRVLLWDLAAPPPLAQRLAAADENTVAALAFSPDGTRLLAARRAGLELWALDPPQRLWQLPDAHGSDIAGLAFLPDGRSAVSFAGYARELKRWSLDDRGARVEARAETARESGVPAFAGAGGEIVLQLGDRLVAHRAGDLARVAEVPAPPGTRFTLVAPGPAADEVTAGTQDGRLLVYGPGLGPRAALAAQGDMPLAVAGEPRTGLVAAVVRGRNDRVLLWERGASAPSGNALRAGLRQGATASVLAVAADGRTLLGGGAGFTTLWDLELRAPLGIPLPGHRDGPKAVAASTTRPLVATGSWNGEILLWDLDPAHWMQQACRIANRNLSCAEWRSHQGGRDWQATCPALPAPQPACRF